MASARPAIWAGFAVGSGDAVTEVLPLEESVRFLADRLKDGDTPEEATVALMRSSRKRMNRA